MFTACVLVSFFSPLFALHEPPQRVTSHEPLQTEPKGLGATSFPISLPQSVTPQQQLHSPTKIQQQPPQAEKSQRQEKKRRRLGLSLKTTVTTAATYRDTRSRPRTSSHMSGVNPIRMMVVAAALLSLLSSSPLLSPLSHQSLLPPLRLLT